MCLWRGDDARMGEMIRRFVLSVISIASKCESTEVWGSDATRDRNA